MIKININGTEREWRKVDTNWVHEQIDGRQRNDKPVCVIVKIKSGDINLMLSVGDCPVSSGGGCLPNQHEQEVFTLWDRMGLKSIPINSGNLVAFLQQINRC